MNLSDRLWIFEASRIGFSREQLKYVHLLKTPNDNLIYLSRDILNIFLKIEHNGITKYFKNMHLNIEDAYFQQVSKEHPLVTPWCDLPIKYIVTGYGFRELCAISIIIGKITRKLLHDMFCIHTRSIIK